MEQKRRYRFTHFFQQALMTVDLFGRNELANHAAAGSYGFLLSATPVFLIAAIFISQIFSSSPQAITNILSSLGEVVKGIDAEAVVRSYLSKPVAGFSLAIAVITLIWTARVFALSLQRGMRVIFSATDRPTALRENILTFAIELAVVAYAGIYALTSRAAIRFTEYIGLEQRIPNLPEILGIISIALPIGGLGLLCYSAYRFIPHPRPSKGASLKGSLLCVGLFTVTAFCFRLLVNSSRYNLVYGALGTLMVFLANVYFFFSYFFWGAQLAFVIDSFDALMFSRLRKVNDTKGSRLERKLFAAPDGLIRKYARTYRDGEYLFQQGEMGQEIYYVIKGSIAISLPEVEGKKREVAILGAGSFFGEMAYLLAEARTASARAVGEALVLCLPPKLFDNVLKTDSETARHVIGSLSERLKKTNESLGLASHLSAGVYGTLRQGAGLSGSGESAQEAESETGPGGKEPRHSETGEVPG